MSGALILKLGHERAPILSGAVNAEVGDACLVQCEGDTVQVTRPLGEDQAAVTLLDEFSNLVDQDLSFGRRWQARGRAWKKRGIAASLA